MMEAFRRWCESILRIPPDPGPPPGDEATARVFRAAPNYFRLLLVMWGISNLFLFGVFITAFGFAAVVAIVEANRRPGASIVALLFGVGLVIGLLLLLFQAVFRLAVMRLNFEKRWYVVTDRSLRVREGVVHVREMTVSFANIQDVAVTQGPLERMLGLWNVRVTTAGGGGSSHQEHHGGPNLHQAWFRGIDNAEEVRTLILTRLRALKDTGLGNQEEQAAASAADGDGSSGAALHDALEAVLAEARALRQAVSA